MLNIVVARAMRMPASPEAWSSSSSTSSFGDGGVGGGGGRVVFADCSGDDDGEVVFAEGGGEGGGVKPLKHGSEISPKVQLPSHVVPPSSPLWPLDRHWLHWS